MTGDAHCPSPQALMRKYGVQARKSWGQNFLHDGHVIDAIQAAVAREQPQRIVEIGAGLGALTHRLIQRWPVWAIERDRDLCAVLREEFAGHENFQLFEADAVRFNYADADAGLEDGQRPTIVGNLPYQLTGPLLFRLLEYHERTGPWIVMIQREVAERLTAQPGTRDYGGITVAMARERDVSMVCRVPPGCFTPAPKVQSAVIRLDPRSETRGEVKDRRALLELVRSAFQGRRKTLRNALSSIAEKSEVERWCREAEVDAQLRPEKLTPEQFSAIQRARERNLPVDPDHA